jgi:alpha-galactosidase
MNLSTGGMSVSINKNMQFHFAVGNSVNPVEKGYSDIDSLFSEKGSSGKFVLKNIIRIKVNEEPGPGIRYIIKGEGKVGGSKIRKEIFLTDYEKYPSVVFISFRYTNLTSATISLRKIKFDILHFSSGGDDPDFWSFQGESSPLRKSWILPVRKGFYQKNYMGTNESDYGGGIPVSCLWRKDAGFSVGHISGMPEIVSLPVLMGENDKSAEMCIERNFDLPFKLAGGESFSTITSFIESYNGDCFMPLRRYASIMAKHGIIMPESEPDAFGSAWCTWGYGSNFTVKEIMETLPMVKRMGIKWVTVDDGFQRADGDWRLNKKKFPEGDSDMKKLVDVIHNMGMKAQIWYKPLVTEPDVPFLKEYPNCLVEDISGQPYNITGNGKYEMSPADNDVIAETRSLITRYIRYYGFDGIKLDSHHLNSINPDYNSFHSPKDPYRANRMLPLFYKMIYDTARNLNPHAVIQLCPCGCCFSFYDMPYVNQFVSSDPLDSRQVRTRGYVYRAIAPNTAYFADHVELIDGGDDFASQIGIGAVPGTKFTYPADNPSQKESFLLTPEKQKIWKKAFVLYEKHKLSVGEYVPGYYDIGYDKPETHLIKKGDTLYYAFYADDYCGDIDFRGLKEGRYEVYDYYHNRCMGEIDASDHIMKNIKFHGSLLIELNKKLNR